MSIPGATRPAPVRWHGAVVLGLFAGAVVAGGDDLPSGPLILAAVSMLVGSVLTLAGVGGRGGPITTLITCSLVTVQFIATLAFTLADGGRLTFWYYVAFLAAVGAVGFSIHAVLSVHVSEVPGRSTRPAPSRSGAAR